MIEHKASDRDMDIEFLKEVEEEAELIFQDMLEEDVSFCNDNENDGRNDLLKHLED